MPNRDPQVPLEFGRSALIAIGVVMGCAVFWPSHGFFWQPDNTAANRSSSISFPFGPIVDSNIELSELGIQLDQVDGFLYFNVNADDETTPSQITFFNREQSLLGRIRSFDPRQDLWPPTVKSFVDATVIDLGSDEVEAQSPFQEESEDDLRLQVQAKIYENSRIMWASPRMMTTSPSRVHLGKCDVGDRAVLICVYEWDSASPKPEYGSGPLAEIANSIGPL